MTKRSRAAGAVPTFLSVGGELGRLIAEYDWASTSIGPIDAWPAPLLTTTALILQSPLPIVTLWGDDGIMIYNDAYAGFAGSRHPQLLGSRVREGWDEVADFNDNVMNVCMAGGTLSYQDLQLDLYRAGRATQAWLDLFYSPVRDEQGAPIGVIALVVETTDRVLARRALHESEQRFRALVHATTYVVYRMNADWSEMLSLEGQGFLADADQPTDAWLRDYVDPDEQPRVTAAVRDAIARRGVFELEHRVRRADGSLGWTLSRAVPIMDGNGEIIEWFGTASDVTDRRVAQERLVELNATLEQRVTEVLAQRRVLADIVESTDALVQVVDFNYDWIAVNQASFVAFERLFGVRPTPGRNMLDAFSDRPEMRELWQRVWARAFGGEQFTETVELGDRANERQIYEMKFYVLRDNDGRRIGAYQFAYDISERVRAESRLAQTEEQLRQAQKMEAVGQLTGGIAHDFNNLLAGISGSLELLSTRLAQGKSDAAAQYINAAQGAAKRAAALTHRLLAFSRRQTLDPKPVQVNKLVAGMEPLIRRTVGPEIDVEFIGAAGLWMTYVDSNQLENALLNLCINARDAMPSGGKLTIETGNRWMDERAARERQLAPGQYISLCVSDTGTGMTPEVVAHAFDPFYTTKPIGMGTGLGLSMIYGFAKQSGGQVRIYSEVNEGAMVCLYLPRVDGEEAVEANAAPQDARKAKQGQTILVVDDEPTIRMVVSDLLGERGYAVLEAEDGASALEILRSDARIDLLISDVGLPGGMNGRQVADAGRTLRPGMQVLTKPFAMDVLASKVASLLAPQRRH